MNKTLKIIEFEETEDYVLHVKQAVLIYNEGITIFIDTQVVFNPAEVPYWSNGKIKPEDMSFFECLAHNSEWHAFLDFTICQSQMTEDVLISRLEWLRIWKKLVQLGIIHMKKNWKILSI